MQKLEQDKSVIREQFRKKEQDAEFKANQEMEKSVNDFVSEGTSAFNNFLITITTTKGKGSEFRFLAEEWQKVVFGMEKDFLQMILRTAENTTCFYWYYHRTKKHSCQRIQQDRTWACGWSRCQSARRGCIKHGTGRCYGYYGRCRRSDEAPQAALATSLTTLTPVIATTAAESPQLAAITPLNAEFLVMTTTITSQTAALAAASVAVSTDTAAETAEAVAIGVDTAASAAQTPAIIADTAATIIHTAALGFDEGGYVPRTGMAMLHKGERVATPDMWSEIGDMGKQGGDSEGGGHTFHINHNTNVSALDGADVSKILRKNSSKVGKELMRAIKSGSLRLPR